MFSIILCRFSVISQLQICYGTTQYPSASVNPTNSWSDVDACSYAGDYAVINVNASTTYEFS